MARVLAEKHLRVQFVHVAARRLLSKTSRGGCRTMLVEAEESGVGFEGHSDSLLCLHFYLHADVDCRVADAYGECLILVRWFISPLQDWHGEVARS